MRIVVMRSRYDGCIKGKSTIPNLGRCIRILTGREKDREWIDAWIGFQDRSEENRHCVAVENVCMVVTCMSTKVLT